LIVIDSHAQAPPDQSRRYGVEDAPQGEAAGRGDRDHLLLEVDGAPGRQRGQRRAFQRNPFALAGVPPADDLVDEGAPGGEIGEVARSAQQQRVFKRQLQMPMNAFDRSVLMGDAGIVARGRHFVVRHQPSWRRV
jgi:hypothetical protein